jgi:hypothetical protein
MDSADIDREQVDFMDEVFNKMEEVRSNRIGPKSKQPGYNQTLHDRRFSGKN